MDTIKNNFSIKDLENITGVKAHTIRIWEKRYDLLSPERSETNIRYYSNKNLQKLLNIVLLNNNNYKISKISEMKESLKRVPKKSKRTRKIIRKIKTTKCFVCKPSLERVSDCYIRSNGEFP